MVAALGLAALAACTSPVMPGPMAGEASTTVDILDYLVGDASTWPRIGALYMNQVVDPVAQEICWVKYGNPRRFECWRWDDRYVYHETDNAIDGNTGDDLMDYSAVGSAIAVNLSSANINTGVGTVAASTASAQGTDTLLNIERIIATPGNDTLVGSSGSNLLAGGSGSDSIDGGDGADTVSGGDGSDNVRGMSGNDTLSGGTGSNTLDGGSGIDCVTDLVTGAYRPQKAVASDSLDAAKGDPRALMEHPGYAGRYAAAVMEKALEIGRAHV